MTSYVRGKLLKYVSDFSYSSEGKRDKREAFLMRRVRRGVYERMAKKTGVNLKPGDSRKDVMATLFLQKFLSSIDRPDQEKFLKAEVLPVIKLLYKTT